jgi:hypothetical protein
MAEHFHERGDGKLDRIMPFPTPVVEQSSSEIGHFGQVLMGTGADHIRPS